MSRMPERIHRILFVELLGGIGDLVIALPAIHSLARSHPSARLTVLTFAPGAELLRHDPDVHRTVVAPKGAARQAVEEILAAESFDLVVCDTSYEGIDALVRAAAPRTVANLWRAPPPGERVGERFVRLLVDDGVVDRDASRRAASI